MKVSGERTQTENLNFLQMGVDSGGIVDMLPRVWPPHVSPSDSDPGQRPDCLPPAPLLVPRHLIRLVFLLPHNIPPVLQTRPPRASAPH